MKPINNSKNKNQKKNIMKHNRKREFIKGVSEILDILQKLDSFFEKYPEILSEEAFKSS
jgi:hypothetical protein